MDHPLLALFAARLPLVVKRPESTLHIELAPEDSRVDEEGRLLVCLRPLVFVGTELREVLETTQVLIPSVHETPEADARTFIEAWLIACERIMTQLAPEAGFDFAYPFGGHLADEPHPLHSVRGGGVEAYVEAILALRARELALEDSEEAELRAVSEQLEPLLKPTWRPYLRLIPAPKQEAGLLGTRLGGVPYLPPEVEYPRNQNGQPLLLALQLNFAELPALPGFPTSGILQFFVTDDYGHGIHYLDGTRQEGFRVLYHPTVDAERARPEEWFQFVPPARNEDAPGARTCALRAELRQAPMSMDDYRFDETLAPGGFSREFFQDERFLGGGTELLNALLNRRGHKLGGYPGCYSGDDPRGHESLRDQGFELLVQLDSDDSVPMAWGRDQVAKLFIRPEDLARLDFSRVLFDVS